VPVSWEVSAFLGQPAQVQMVDEASGSWEHLSVNRILQTDQPERLPVVTEPLCLESLRPQFSRPVSGPWIGSIPAGGKKGGSMTSMAFPPTRSSNA
jgi:hypothetical protein